MHEVLLGHARVAVLPQRGRDRGLAAHGDEIRRDEARRPFGDRAHVDVVGQRHPGEQPVQQLGAGAQIGKAETQLAVDEVRGAQAGVDGLGCGRGRDDREAGGGDRVAQGVEDEGRQRGRRHGREQRLDVGHDEHRARAGPSLLRGHP